MKFQRYEDAVRDFLWLLAWDLEVVVGIISEFGVSMDEASEACLRLAEALKDEK